MTTRKLALLTALPLFLLAALTTPEADARTGAPFVDHFYPIEGAPGDLIQIHGSGLGRGGGGRVVQMVRVEGRGSVRLSIESWSDDLIEARIPNTRLRRGEYDVFVHLGKMETIYCEQGFWIKGPQIVDFDTEYMGFGILGIQARYIGWNPKVKIGKKSAKVLRVESISPSGRRRRIVVRIPRGLKPDLYWVQVKTKSSKARAATAVGSAQRLGRPKFEYTMFLYDTGREWGSAWEDPKHIRVGLQPETPGFLITLDNVSNTPHGLELEGEMHCDVAPLRTIRHELRHRAAVDNDNYRHLWQKLERIGDLSVDVSLTGFYIDRLGNQYRISGRYLLKIDPQELQFRNDP